VRAGTPEFDQVTKLRKELTRLLCGDPMPDHAAALLRVVGSHNSKYGEPRLCQVIRPGEPIDITEIEELVDLLANRPLFEPRPKTNGHGHAEGNPQFVSDSGPIDVDERLAAMRFKGAGNNAVHMTQLQCSAAMLRTGVALEEMARTVLEATHAAVGNDAEWDWRKEELKILRLGADFIRKNPELTNLLPDEWQQPFAAALAQGHRPDIGLNPGGFYVRAWKTKAAESGTNNNGDTSKAGPAKNGERKIRFPLINFQDMRPGLEPVYLVDELIPSAGIVLVWGALKTFKSFWLLDLMLYIAMGWTYRERAVRQGGRHLLCL
jgi:hypothetical protein